ncbi:hypothetical protein RvY_06573-2 [Ramazzottius varieornatus]|nr:hypothetical protein RvY_06573-2 [Ramazzottius varieornatus]
MDTLNKACRNVRYMFDNTITDPVQIRVRELTTNEQWGPAASEMAQLAEMSYTKSPVIVADLFLRTTDTHWRVVYKSLLVIDYLLKNGSETVVMACMTQLSQLMDLQHAKYVDNGVEKGQGIRERARKIVVLLTDTPALKAERAKAKRIMERVPYQHPQFRNFFNGALPTTTKNAPLSCSERDVELLDAQARASRTRPASPPSFQRPQRSPPPRLPTAAQPSSASTPTSLAPISLEEEERQLQMALAASRISAEHEGRQDQPR